MTESFELELDLENFKISISVKLCIQLFLTKLAKFHFSTTINTSFIHASDDYYALFALFLSRVTA
jgi:hypothetical protein